MNKTSATHLNVYFEANSSPLHHLGTSPSPLIMWSPMGSESSMQPPSCPPSNEGWPKEEPVKIWPKEEPVDIEMHPTPMVEMPPAPLPDHTMQPPPLPDTLFATPETWISSLPSKHPRLCQYPLIKKKKSPPGLLQKANLCLLQ